MTPHRSPGRRKGRARCDRGRTTTPVVALIALIALVAGAAPTVAQSSGPQPRRGPVADLTPVGPDPVMDPAPGESTRVVVELARSTRSEPRLSARDAEAQQQAIAAAQTEVSATLAGTGSEVTATFDHVAGMAVEATAKGLSRLRASPAVAAIRPDGVARPLLDVSTALVRAPDAWATADGSGRSVAIIDTGVDRRHDFLDGKVVGEVCFADDVVFNNAPAGDCPNGRATQSGVGSAAPCAQIGCEHGTHVAGIAAGDGEPQAGTASYAGVAKGANVVAAQVFHSDGGSVLAYFSDIVQALDSIYSVRDTYSVAAVNMSLGGFLFDRLCDDEIEPLMFDAVQNLKDAGVATVVASGNDGSLTALSFPACLSNVISVGNVLSGKAGTEQDTVAFDSNAARFLRLLAPGAPVTSAVPDATVPRNAVESISGTSMAAPHVAGAIAVLRAAGVGTGLGRADLVDRLHGVLRASGPCVQDPGNRRRYARLDVQAALDLVGLPSALFWDIGCGAWYEDAADWLGFDPDGSGGPIEPLASGFPDGSFGGDAPITRAQDARMVHRLFGAPAPTGGYSHGFTDVPPWITAAVNWMNWPGGPAAPDPLMSGTGSRFRPNGNITRAEKARQLYRAAGSPAAAASCPAGHGFTDVPAWVDDAVRWISCPAHGPGGTTAIATGYPDSTFHPNDPITRAENARMLQRFHDAGHGLP